MHSGTPKERSEQRVRGAPTTSVCDVSSAPSCVLRTVLLPNLHNSPTLQAFTAYVLLPNLHNSPTPQAFPYTLPDKPTRYEPLSTKESAYVAHSSLYVHASQVPMYTKHTTSW